MPSELVKKRDRQGSEEAARCSESSHSALYSQPRQRSHPWIPALLYLLAIPIFASIYNSFSGEFLHTTVEHEPYLQADERSILDAIRNAMEPHPYLNSAPSGPTRDIPWKYVRLFDLESDGRYSASFSLSGSFDSQPQSPGPSPLRCQLDLYWRREALSPPAGWAYPISLPSLRKSQSDLAQRMFPLPPRFRSPGEVDANDGTVGYLVLTDDLVNRMREWANARRGFPAQSSGSYARMLYLSAITITTVGFGDILPITDRARFAVAFEAVLGIVLIGLFLSALTDKISGRR